MQGKLIILTLFIIFSVIPANAQRFVSKGKDTIDTSVGQNWSISLGYSSIPTKFGEASLFADVPEHPVLNESLPEVTLNGGFHLATLFHFREKWYWGLSYSNNSSNASPNRGRDFVSSFGLNFGQQIPLKYESEDFFASFELGIASYNARRSLVGFRDYSGASLRRQSGSFTPAIRFDTNLYKEQIYLFVQAKYFVNFGGNVRIRLSKFNEIEDETEYSSIRFDTPGVEVSESAQLKVRRPYEIVIGIRYNFDF